jgi:hypothetical protein
MKYKEMLERNEKGDRFERKQALSYIFCAFHSQKTLTTERKPTNVQNKRALLGKQFFRESGLQQLLLRHPFTLI